MQLFLLLRVRNALVKNKKASSLQSASSSYLLRGFQPRQQPEPEPRPEPSAAGVVSHTCLLGSGGSRRKTSKTTTKPKESRPSARWRWDYERYFQSGRERRRSEQGGRRGWRLGCFSEQRWRRDNEVRRGGLCLIRPRAQRIAAGVREGERRQSRGFSTADSS